MSQLHMIELRPDPAALIRFAEAQGINRREDEDLGYAAHAWLAALFGANAPKPFRLLQDQRNIKPPRLLGYTGLNKEELVKYAQIRIEEAANRPGQYSEGKPEQAEAIANAQASILALQVCPFQDGIATHAMPDTWREGLRMGFELLACPVSRIGQREDDVYRRHLREREEQGQAHQSRENVYRDWLARQFGAAASLAGPTLEKPNQEEVFRLDGFRNVRLLRKAEGAGRRGFLAPQVLFGGVLQVQDGEAFKALLARGIGRHRAFGYGMLLLRPAP